MRATKHDIYEALENVDLEHDLSEKTLHVTAGDLAWDPVSRYDGLTRAQLHDLYYYMVLTRATDREITKLSRKGMAIGKHLMCTGNEASAVGSTYALRPD